MMWINANEGAGDHTDYLNLTSLKILPGCKIEPSLKDAKRGERFQFERLGYFFVDPVDSTAEKPVFNRIVSLRDTWQKIDKRAKG